jgi:transposase-like protein
VLAVKRPRAGVHYPRDWGEFLKLFSSEEDCLEFLERVRWGDSFYCPHCGSIGADFWRMGDGRRRCKECRGETTVTAGTIFHATRKDLRLWFATIWQVVNAKNGVSAMTVQRTLGFKSYQTAWAWLHKLRRAMVRPGRDQLRGKVEVDEVVYGGVKRGMGGGRGAPGKTKVAVGVEDHGKGAGRVRMEIIPDESKKSLHGFITRNIEKGSTIITDGWQAYQGLERLGYEHEPRTILGSQMQANDLLPHVHRVASLSKRWLMGTHQGSFSPEQLGYYLDEYTFRFNRRHSKNRGMLFYRLIEQAVATDPQPYRDLIA